MAELNDCRSLAEAGKRVTAFMIESFGATAAAVFDVEGPVAAHPARIPAPLIGELGEIPPGVGAWSPVETESGLVAISYLVGGSDRVRVVSAWERTNSGSVSRVRTVAEVLAGWLEDADSDSIKREWPKPEYRRHPLNNEDFANLIEAIPAIFYIAEMGVDGRWHYVSPQIEKVLGYSPAEWMEDHELWYRSIHPDDLEHALSFEDKRLIGLDMMPPAAYRLRTKEGRYIWIYERSRLIRNQEGTPLWHGVVQDVTALKEAEISLARKVEQQAILAKLGEMAVQGVRPDELLENAVRRIAGLESAIEVSVWEQVSDDTLGVIARSGNLGKYDRIPFLTDDFPGADLIRGRPALIQSWDNDDHRLDPFRETRPPEAASSFAAPIFGTDEGFGFLLIHSDHEDAFSAGDSDFLLATAGMLGNAIQRSRADHQLRHRLDHDSLTELPNRRYFESRLGKALAAADLNETTVALIFLDLDHFKLINDGVGHGAGDEVLRTVAPRLTRGVRHNDTVARFGGDEFGVILPAVADADEATEVAERILASISEPIRVDGAERRITASAGISIRHPGGNREHSVEDMIREADAAMYSAKEAGRSTVHVFDGSIQERVIKRLETERELRAALANGELAVAYQPIIELKGGRLTGFEALVRWNHREKGVILPEDFIPIAEQSELIREVDSWVLARAVGDAAEWNRGRAADDAVGVSVNCSARQIGNLNLAGLVRDLLDRHQLAPEQITLELVETTLLSGNRHVGVVLAELDGLGVRLSLDDFGTGFSSLGYLAEFPLDEVKIDRKFIELVSEGDRRGSAIAGAIIQIGKALSMTVVAEAVNADDVLDLIREMGCHRAQGFMISKPLSPGEATELALQDGWTVYAD